MLVTRCLAKILAGIINRDPDELLKRVAQEVAPQIDRLKFPSADSGAAMREAAHGFLAKITETAKVGE